MLTTILHSPAAHGALAGWLSAAATDFHAFRAWQSFKDVRAYNWGTAIFRWVQGAVIGAVSGAGLTALVGGA